MSTSTFARSASGSQTVSGAQVWNWTFPGAPICINLSRSLVTRLQNDLDARTRFESNAGRELGGVLFGHQRGKDSVVDVDDYIWLPSEPAQDGTYSLNTVEVERLRAERAGSSSIVIGYFRTDFGANLELRDAEIDLIGKQFSDPMNVVLLICSSRPHTGGFFFWMGEGVISPFSLMDFPLDVMRLPFHEDSEAREPVPSPISEMPLALSKVSVASVPASAPPPAEPALVQPETDAVTWPVLEPAPKRIFGSPATVVQMPLKQASVAPVVTISQPQTEKVPLSQGEIHEAALRETPASEKPTSEKETQSRSKGAWVAVLWTLTLLIGLCLSAGVIVLVFRGGPLWVSTPAPVAESKPQPPPAVPFQLNVEAQGTGLNIRWNAQSAAVAGAHEGQLTISETNKQPVVIPLTAQQLTIGHIYFQSSAERLEVQLETTDNAGKLSRESVLALSSLQRPAASPQPAASVWQQPKPNVSPVVSQTTPVPWRRVETISIPAAPAAEKSPSRAFTAPAPNRSVPRLPVIDQPAVPAPQLSASVPVPLSNSVLSTRVAPPPASPANAPVPPRAAPQSAPQIVPQQIRVTSSLQAARLVKKVAPVYPSVAIAGRVQGVVKFTATIGKDGTIRNLQFLSGPSVLAKAATDAVRQWTYQPTLLNGSPVEVVTEIDLNFTLSR